MFLLNSQQSKTQCQIDKQRGFSQIYFDLNEDQQDNNGGENVSQVDSDPQKGGSVKNEQKGTIKVLFTQKWNLQRITYKKQRIKQKEHAIARNV